MQELRARLPLAWASLKVRIVEAISEKKPGVRFVQNFKGVHKVFKKRFSIWVEERQAIVEDYKFTFNRRVT